ncbi:hypothetical protein [uncultured Roseibium sp.]|uniref:hypothetical protein n=1 Tax=uncultured Roseibium sp. TaxID=1936171 RepID=UPI00262F24C6|nr:hypothetical protein [uncultured Roseibium sp.]
MKDTIVNLGPVKLLKDPFFRLLAINAVAGFCIAMLVLAGIFWANIGNLRVLVSTAEDPFLPVLMLAFGLVITLGSVVIGSAIMLLGERNSSGGTPRKLFPFFPTGSPLPVRAEARRRTLDSGQGTP